MEANYSAAEDIKVRLLSMIEDAQNPFDIIMFVAKALEKMSNEVGYSKNVEENLRTVYGFTFLHEKLLTDELKEVEDRLKIIEERMKSDKFTEEEKVRMGFAADKHKKDIERIKLIIEEAKANGETLTVKR
ncbi:MAG: hypothetical protein IKN43_00165 [Selenomonadaceae bacterium]|nr:hypothetical protein [Selenomonadaceae bacterium]